MVVFCDRLATSLHDGEVIGRLGVYDAPPPREELVNGYVSARAGSDESAERLRGKRVSMRRVCVRVGESRG